MDRFNTMNSKNTQHDSSSDPSGKRVIVSGTGGQGVLTVARLLCDVFVQCGHQVVSGQLHGMAQRGGSVQSTIMINSGMSPVIPRGKADYVLGFEPVETVRVLPYMSSQTKVFMNRAPVVPYVLGQRFVLKEGNCEYPDVEHLIHSIRSVTPFVYSFDATQVAQEVGSTKTLNMVMLGCLLQAGELYINADQFWNAVGTSMPPSLAEINARAFLSGLEWGKKFKLGEVSE